MLSYHALPFSIQRSTAQLCAAVCAAIDGASACQGGRGCFTRVARNSVRRRIQSRPSHAQEQVARRCLRPAPSFSLPSWQRVLVEAQPLQRLLSKYVMLEAESSAAHVVAVFGVRHSQLLSSTFAATSST